MFYITCSFRLCQTYLNFVKSMTLCAGGPDFCFDLEDALAFEDVDKALEARESLMAEYGEDYLFSILESRHLNN